MNSTLGEFNLIQRFFKNKNLTPRTDVYLGIGDDCALLTCPPNQHLAISMDTLVSGVHFPQDTNAYDIGFKALAVNLSDLAAMGAAPAWAMLSLTLPEANEQWLEEFSAGFFNLANQYSVELVGGDITKGPLSITIQVHGWVPKAQAVTRSQAKPGDLIYVSNTIGDAGLGLRYLQNLKKIDEEVKKHCLERLFRPHPRVSEGIFLRDFASAMIDISDGLAADLGHILTMSKVGARINLENLPLSPELKKSLALEEAIALALSAGDDYELCFTIPPSLNDAFQKAAGSQGFRFTCIGEITASSGLQLSFKGKTHTGKISGYTHF